MKWVEISYECTCFRGERFMHVPARGKRQDVLDFMTHVQELVSADHAINSPMCMQTKMRQVKIPVYQDKVGSAEGGEA